MRAVIRSNPKDPLTLTLDPSHPAPTPTEHPTGYLIRPKATALTRDELTWPEPLVPENSVPGFDLAGEVISVPIAQGSYRFKPGDEVYGFTTFTWKGNAREVSVGQETEMALKPKGLGWEEAASVPLSALSAWQALFLHGGLKAPGEGGEKGSNAGKRVLITAASGGVGIWGVQLAHHAGVAEVVGTCGTSNVDFVKSLGADNVLDYRKTDLLEWVGQDRESRGFDVVLDCIGGQTLADAWKCARNFCKVISVAEPPNPKKPGDGIAEGVEGVWFIVEPNGEQLGEVTKLIEQAKCRAVVDSVFELEQFKEAFERLEGRHARGKVVLRVA
ncbi:zinc-binding oxidoreductase [Byssothecium circinans]|uniref:Zinc-binding oxidoreductase n=1 Tax=Byssothecium circinans TaxID=147558 RepID=A0A6A5TY30_9PLEO|nr:zinc-binding oxidoreductase [Byssothecium circinans]